MSAFVKDSLKATMAMRAPVSAPPLYVISRGWFLFLLEYIIIDFFIDFLFVTNYSKYVYATHDDEEDDEEDDDEEEQDDEDEKSVVTSAEKNWRARVATGE